MGIQVIDDNEKNIGAGGRNPIRAVLTLSSINKAAEAENNAKRLITAACRKKGNTDPLPENDAGIAKTFFALILSINKVRKKFRVKHQP